MRFFRLAPLCALLLLAPPATAQSETRVGIGIRLNELVGATRLLVFDEEGVEELNSGVTVLVPMDLGGLRLEPELVYRRSANSTSFGTIDRKDSRSELALGVGIFGRAQEAASVTALYGARVRYSRQAFLRERNGDTDEDSVNGFALGPVLGAEYAISERFALGGEAGIFYQRTSPSDLPDNTESSSSLVNTQVSLFLRFFL